MTRIVLVRHAEAVCNVEGKVAGHRSCAGLTSAGRGHCASVAARLREVCGADAEPVLVASAMRRARETAELIASALQISPPADGRCGLCERHPGSYEGLSLEQFKGLAVGGDAMEGLERLEAFALRVRRELLRLAATHAGSTIVAVTHSGVVGLSFWALGGLPARMQLSLKPANGSITEWSMHSGDPGRWRLQRYNDVPVPAA
ncbi:histidine phosphatase family protein [Dactylosporangium sp. CA-139066]|uniref:histidine phosphatase family protein n=1 Tax=Dactylosporangium sp. CA-139066 TaxID=3239930 RepID=UPI003D8F9D2E